MHPSFPPSNTYLVHSEYVRPHVMEPHDFGVRVDHGHRCGQFSHGERRSHVGHIGSVAGRSAGDVALVTMLQLENLPPRKATDSERHLVPTSSESA